MLALVTGCFVRPVPGEQQSVDAAPDARLCPMLFDDFNNAAGPGCGTWGAPSSTEAALMRTGMALQTTVMDGTKAGCLSSALDLRNGGVWVEIDLRQSGSDLTSFTLQFGASRFVSVDFDNNGTPTWQGKASAGIPVTPSVTQAHARDTQKYWRFTRGEDDSLGHGIDLSASQDGVTYLPLIHYSVSGAEPVTVTPTFYVTGANLTAPHASTAFDNYNAPCQM